MNDTGTPTARLWAAIGPIFEAIERHPFLLGLADGTLPRDRFAYYISQDALYLREFARVLSALAVSGPEGSVGLFGRHATDALAVEEALHGSVVLDLGLHPEQVRASEMMPTCRAYADFLMATALGRPFHEGLGAVLPCYWIYQKVGASLVEKGSPDPVYGRWIATYGGEAFDAVVGEVLALTDREGLGLTDAQFDAMRHRFVTASRYEWMFWEMAHRLERWPV